jgi:hypothetical protein
MRAVVYDRYGRSRIETEQKTGNAILTINGGGTG